MVALRVDRTDRGRIVLASAVTLVALPLVIHASQKQDRDPTVAVVSPDAGLASQLQPTATPAAGGVAASPTVAPTTAPPATAPPSSIVTEGEATWDRWSPGTVPVTSPCVTPLAATGREVTVINLDTGRRVTCTVVEHGPLPEGVIVKLDAPVFQQLADLGEQPIPVRVIP